MWRRRTTQRIEHDDAGAGDREVVAEDRVARRAIVAKIQLGIRSTERARGCSARHDDAPGAQRAVRARDGRRNFAFDIGAKHEDTIEVAGGATEANARSAVGGGAGADGGAEERATAMNRAGESSVAVGVVLRIAGEDLRRPAGGGGKECAGVNPRGGPAGPRAPRGRPL